MGCFNSECCVIDCRVCQLVCNTLRATLHQNTLLTQYFVAVEICTCALINEVLCCVRYDQH